VINTLDFETLPIEGYRPPKPVGFSLWLANTERPKYYAFGHPSGNNCTQEEARQLLADIWDQPILCHNARFDLEVAREHLNLPYPTDPLLRDDTQYLLFLNNPHSDSLSLKPSAQSLLGIDPDEQSAIHSKLASLGFKSYDFAKLPGNEVAEYANGDTLRTRALYEFLLPRINAEGMLPAYRRELRLAPILSANQRDGIRINAEQLYADLERWEGIYVDLNANLARILGDINLDSGAELASALLTKGLATEADFKRTPTGRLSTAKDSLAQAVKDPALAKLLSYRGNLKTILGTFLRGWASKVVDGRLHPQFHQVRGTDFGTRTGRMSSSDPNFQNVPTEFSEPPEGWPQLPAMRSYILPDEGHVLVAADFASQEFRIAAHYAEGRAAEIYQNDPKADFHAKVAELLQHETGLVLPRKKVKIIGFSLLYGSGSRKLAESLGVDEAEARRLKMLYFQVLPGMEDLMKSVSSRGRKGEAVKTWGERKIYAEEPKRVNGRYMDFSYKLVNYLIQGSAADQTKEAIIRAGYRTSAKRFLISVHDENVYSVEPDALRRGVAEIRSAMEETEGWDVPWKTSVEVGENWWNLRDYDTLPNGRYTSP
jgi:DNA polymerase-1